MGSRFRKYSGIVLVLVYAFFFASINFFYHTHQLADGKIVHSHPFSIPGHSHTVNQIIVVDAADSAIFQEAAELSVPNALPGFPSLEVSDYLAEDVIARPFSSCSLRAPPASC